jgi:hypothetical protein
MEYSAERIAGLLFIPNRYNIEYGGVTYNFRFYDANLNQNAVPILNDHIRFRFSETEAEEMILFMSFYWKFRGSPALGTKLPERVIRIGVRKFDVRTLGTQKMSAGSERKAKEYLTFSRNHFNPSKTKTGWERYRFYVENKKLEEKALKLYPLISERFQSAIYYPHYDKMEFNETEFNDYAEGIYNKILKLTEIENKFWSEKTAKEKKSGERLKNMKMLQQQFVAAFSDDIKTPLFKRLFYELESLFMCFWEEIFERVYIFLSPELTSVERKAYLLAYMRQEYLGYQIPLFEPIFEEFQRTLTQTSTDEILYGLLFCEEKAKSALIYEKFEQKFADFLIFYPIWLHIIRLDESITPENLVLINSSNVIPKKRPIRKKRIKNETTGKLEWRRITQSFDSIYEQKMSGDEQFTLEDILPGPDIDNSSYDSEKIKKIVDKLTKKQKEVFNYEYQSKEKLNQEDIAKKLGISQSAVNQRLKNAEEAFRKEYLSTL